MIRSKTVVIDLLSPRGHRPLAVAAIVEACALFGISSNNVRVTLARLVAQQRLQKIAHGEYALSPGAQSLNRHVRGWSRLDALEKPWSGKWTMVHLERTPAASERDAVQRALRYGRIAMVTPTLGVRPDNLRLDSAGMRDALRDFGLGLPFFVTRAEVDAEIGSQWSRTLWPIDKLRTAHNQMTARLNASIARIERIVFNRALAETFLLGGEAIRHLVLDPILPETIMPGRERAMLLETMRTYDRIGRSLWRRFNQRFETAPKTDFAPFQSAGFAGAANS